MRVLGFKVWGSGFGVYPALLPRNVAEAMKGEVSPTKGSMAGGALEGGAASGAKARRCTG